MPRRRNSASVATLGDVNGTQEAMDADAAVARSLQFEDLSYYTRHHLSREERLVVMLRYSEELAFDEIAGILDLPLGEVELMHDEVVDRLRQAIRPARRQAKPCLAER